MKYVPVIGLEIHIQAKTKSKMFCSCSSEYFGDAPNTHVCPVCLGLPGALPVPNEKGVEQCLKLALALNCEINRETKFDRKNYFYPDLPKGYQISQYDQPIGRDGYLEIAVEGDARRIRIRRVHLEEDTGKSVHESNKTLLDFNKSGVALIEAVTEPDFVDVKEVAAFARLLHQTVRYLGVSDAEMQKGQMRFELNISVKKPDAKELPNYKVEVKNIGSISVLEKVIEFEIDRQAALLEKGETPINETRGIRDLSGITYSQRTKETEGDYRYFPEPDIPPLLISEKQIEDTKDTQPELPAARKQRYMQDWGLEGEQVEILVEQSDKGDWMDDFQQETRLDSALIAEAVKWFIGDISGLLEKNNLNVAELPITHTDLAYLVEALGENKISGSIVKKVLDMIFSGEEKSAEDIVSKQNLEQVSDPKELQVWAKAAIKENPQLVASLEKNPNAIKALVGQVMKLSRGRANPQLVESILHELLKVRA